MADRYFVSPPITKDAAQLADAEAHHLLHVMRAKPGAEVVLFDGSGAEFTARVVKTSRATVDLEVLNRHEIDRELPGHLTLGVALPKGDRQKWLIEKAVELGVTELVPLETERGVAQPVASALTRLERSVVEASKQCGRNRLMTIAAPVAWREFITMQPGATRWLAHPRTAESLEPETQLAADLVLAIGPEGGFSETEVALARAAAWQVVDLGPRILRIETAALALVALAAARLMGRVST